MFNDNLIRSGFSRTVLACAVALAFSQVQAEDAPPANQLETVRVIGQAASIDKALVSQKAADNIETTVTSDAIGQLPDTNVSESLQRLPGVSIERDQGEGRFVRVRGLAPDFNAATINGIQTPAPEADRRAVALDVVPADLLESLTVVKTLTPDMDANSLGGTIEVKTLSAFDRDDYYFSLSGKGGYNDNVDEISPELSVAASNQFSVGDGNRNLGIAGGISWGKRDFGSDNVETGGAWDFDSGNALEEFEQRDYAITRERLGMALNFDYLLSDNTSLYLRTLYSRFTDSEIRQANIFEFDNPMLAGERGDMSVAKELKDREETQDISSFALGGQHFWKDWIVDFQAGYSTASENTPQEINATFETDDVLANGGFTNTRKPLLLAPDGFADAGNYSLAEIEEAKSDTKDTQTDLKLDFTRELYWNSHPASIKFGAKMSQRDKDGDVDIWTHEPDATLTDYRDNVDYALGPFGPGISTSVENLLGDGEFQAVDSAIEDYSISEDRQAAYLMGTVDFRDLRVLGGLRYEGTEFRAKGFGSTDEDITVERFDNDEDHWLPALHLRYQLANNTIARAAATRAVVRPVFEQLLPSFEVDGDEAYFGNPELKSLKSNNLDLGIEHYMGRAGVVSAFVFYKDIDNFAYLTDKANEFPGLSEVETWENGEGAKLHGLELAYSRQLSELPAPFNGLLVGANMTLVDSEAEIESWDEDAGALRRRDITLPSQSDLTGNLVLGYEYQALSLRLAANYTGEYLQEVSDPLDKRYDIYTDDHVQLDFTGHYFLTDELQLTFEAINITDEPFYAYTGKKRFNAQYEEYGPTYKLGLALKHF